MFCARNVAKRTFTANGPVIGVVKEWARPNATSDPHSVGPVGLRFPRGRSIPSRLLSNTLEAVYDASCPTKCMPWPKPLRLRLLPVLAALAQFIRTVLPTVHNAKLIQVARAGSEILGAFASVFA